MLRLQGDDYPHGRQPCCDFKETTIHMEGSHAATSRRRLSTWKAAMLRLQGDDYPHGRQPCCDFKETTIHMEGSHAATSRRRLSTWKAARLRLQGDDYPHGRQPCCDFKETTIHMEGSHAATSRRRLSTWKAAMLRLQGDDCPHGRQPGCDFKETTIHMEGSHAATSRRRLSTWKAAMLRLQGDDCPHGRQPCCDFKETTIHMEGSHAATSRRRLSTWKAAMLRLQGDDYPHGRQPCCDFKETTVHMEGSHAATSRRRLSTWKAARLRLQGDDYPHGRQPGCDFKETTVHMDRSQSPGVASSEAALYRFHTPSPQVRGSHLYLRSANTSLNASMMVNESCLDGLSAPQPEVCLEHLWTEPAPTLRDGPLGKASKVFLSSDLCGQQYLCFMVPYKQQLRCVRFEESNDLSQLIFGAVTVISAKDACPVESLDLLLTLDVNGWVTVHTGTTKINHVHIPLLPLGSASMSLLRATTPQGSPTPGEVFTSSRPPSAMDARFDEEMTHISPVPLQCEGTPSHLEGSLAESSQDASFIQCLRDNVRNSVCVELLNGSLFRTSLPSLCTSSGISVCLKALKHLLPKDTALQLLGRWYTQRNIPGGIGNQSEWHVFHRCLLGLMGYDTSRLAMTSKRELDRSMSPIMSAKRARPSDQGSDEDWEYLVASAHHGHVEEDCVGLEPCPAVCDRTVYSKPCSIHTAALLFPHCPAVLLALHLVYEELKLNILHHGEVECLAPLVYQIARDLRCMAYTDVYCRDFPNLFAMYDEISQVSEEELRQMQYPQVFPCQPPVVVEWLSDSLKGRAPSPFPYIPSVCCSTLNVISLYALMLHKEVSAEQAIERCLRKLAPAGHRAPTAELSLSRSHHASPVTSNTAHRMLLTMTHLGMTQEDIDCLPVGVALPFRETILHCRCNPASDWSEHEYNLIGRQDLWRLVSPAPHRSVKPVTPVLTTTKTATVGKEEDDGMEHIDRELLSLRWSEDLRVQEVSKMLQSSRPVQVVVVQRPEVSDHDFIEEQERHLYSVCIRTMALPLGRGMFTLCTYTPLTTEPLPIPKLCLTGRAPPRNTTVELSRIEVPPNMTSWPHFHNGVAAGLRISNFTPVESAWIIYNRPKNNELTNEYAGFLMALGLNGHLPNLDTLNVHDYLSKGHEMTTIGILLGLAAAKRGTMDMATTKILSVHVPALLPPTSTELNIPHTVQVAAVLGVGLLYQGTTHTHMAEVLLAEIGRPPGPEMENCIDRESYSLAAGLALGLVMFGKGKQAVGLSNHNMADILCHLIVGGQRRPLPGIYRERYRSPSYLIKEGDCVNVDVTSPGATLALGMLFFRSGNSAVAEWLQAPDTQFMLDHVRPDFLLLRTLSRGLVLWDSVVPCSAWLESNIPEIVKKFAFKRLEEEQNEDVDENIDFETMSQAWINIVAGSAMVLGLKFAGTANKAAYDLLLAYMRRILNRLLTPNLCEQAGRSMMENCASVLLVSLAMVGPLNLL
ncbi:hypothetical protein ACOMHN_008994 [Nucella lapillus]